MKFFVIFAIIIVILAVLYPTTEAGERGHGHGHGHNRRGRNGRGRHSHGPRLPPCTNSPTSMAPISTSRPATTSRS